MTPSFIFDASKITICGRIEPDEAPMSLGDFKLTQIDADTFRFSRK